MKDLYTKEYLIQTLEIIADNLKDLSTWSVYNGDMNLDEIHEFIQLYKQLVKLLMMNTSKKGGEENDATEKSNQEQE